MDQRHCRTCSCAEYAEKYCSGCGQTKEARFFPRDERNLDGLNYRCKDCVNDYQRRRREGS